MIITHKKSKRSKKIRKTKKNKKNKTLYRKIGGNSNNVDTVNCCICNTLVNVSDTLIPKKCLDKYGIRSHRICQDCWWNPSKGFAQENVSHACPGCEKKLHLTNITSKPNSKNGNHIIDLTLE